MQEPSSMLTKFIGTPLVGTLYAGATGSGLWLDVIYGLGVRIDITGPESQRRTMAVLDIGRLLFVLSKSIVI
jgi:hypothetical protein